MSFIHLTTFIAAPPERAFDLSRSVDLHKVSMKSHDEKIVAGVTSGLMNVDDSVTWTARHFFKTRSLETRITQMERPRYFVDEQVKGSFSLMKHEHYFKPIENGTIMIDQFRFEMPNGFFGRMLTKIFLERYMTRLLSERNAVIKTLAEGDGWKEFLPS